MDKTVKDTFTVSRPLHRALHHMFDIVERGEIEVKGKGKMTTYFLRQNLHATENEIMGRADKTSGQVDGNGMDTVTFLPFIYIYVCCCSYSEGGRLSCWNLRL